MPRATDRSGSGLSPVKIAEALAVMTAKASIPALMAMSSGSAEALIALACQQGFLLAMTAYFPLGFFLAIGPTILYLTSAKHFARELVSWRKLRDDGSISSETYDEIAGTLIKSVIKRRFGK